MKGVVPDFFRGANKMKLPEAHGRGDPSNTAVIIS
ncbi:hypothetical protein P872_20620 [Rhodonellum psychrophilum GCM71 = DSM 17998]|uniref:Uncharacterized protein n=1 Tax=Rhodonellum psychrophilum GCM71 = DSM 17998 TaxID=1123057 RepID=U5BYY5_9BACT|nr:hypothetical protein P872_20620 [Rhodonellum psychrophilum GCM71 = DSM 17998]